LSHTASGEYSGKFSDNHKIRGGFSCSFPRYISVIPSNTFFYRLVYDMAQFLDLFRIITFLWWCGELFVELRELSIVSMDLGGL
jgi:hypothetical protein